MFPKIVMAIIILALGLAFYIYFSTPSGKPETFIVPFIPTDVTLPDILPNRDTKIVVTHVEDPELTGIDTSTTYLDTSHTSEAMGDAGVASNYMQMSILPNCMPPNDRSETCQALKRQFARNDRLPAVPYDQNKLE